MSLLSKDVMEKQYLKILGLISEIVRGATEHSQCHSLEECVWWWFSDYSVQSSVTTWHLVIPRVF